MNKLSAYRLTIEIFLIAFLLLFPHYVPLPFYSYSFVCLALVLFYLKKQKKTLRNIGLKQKGFTLHIFITGILTGLLWAAFMQWIYIPLIFHFFKPFVKTYTEYDFIKKHSLNLVITIVASWLIAGFYEEIIFRGFIQNTIRRWFGNSIFSFWSGGSFTSVLFGLYHLQNDFFAVISAMLGGLYWTFLLKRYNGNIWITIVSHAVFDTTILLMIYFGVFGK